MALAAKGKKIKKPFNHIVEFKSLNGFDFISFAKSEKFGEDLYADLVAPNLQTDMLVETWPNGPGKLNSSCQKNTYHVLNIDSIDFKSSSDTAFTTTHDHSKWAISSDIKKHPNSAELRDKLKYVCIGDINRMATQYKRGGGTVCFRNEFVWEAFRNLISSFEACPRLDLP